MDQTLIPIGGLLLKVDYHLETKNMEAHIMMKDHKINMLNKSEIMDMEEDLEDLEEDLEDLVEDSEEKDMEINMEDTID